MFDLMQSLIFAINLKFMHQMYWNYSKQIAKDFILE